MCRFEQLTRCRSEEEVKERAGHFAASISFDLWSFSMRLPLMRNASPLAWSIDNLPGPMRQLDGHGLAGLAGLGALPLLQYGIPQAWLLGKSPRVEPTPALRGARDHARALGITGGLCVPVAGPGSVTGDLTLATRHATSEGLLNERRGSALLFSRYLYLACLPFIESMRSSCAPRLSAREIECLSWAARGKTAWETSRLLDVSEHTVVYHMRNAQAKLGAANRQHAISRSIELGILCASGQAAQALPPPEPTEDDEDASAAAA